MTFKLIYSSDLHGNKEFYKRLLKKAEDENCNAIVVGGDLCGKEGSTIQEKIENQRNFLENFMLPLFKQFKSKNKNAEFYVIMGNDDFRINMEILERAEENKIFKSIHNKSIQINKTLNIAGYSFVNPTPFRLKDWEKPDFENDKGPKQLFMEEIRSVGKEFGTIEEDFKKLKKLSSPKKTIYVIHAPPFNTRLDVIAAKAHVGSKAIRKFIEMNQPTLTLHGHIHESPQISGSWKDRIGRTICINVGSSYPGDRLNCAVIDSGDLSSIKYFELK